MRDEGNPIEIAADANVLDAGNFHNMIDTLSRILNGRVADLEFALIFEILFGGELVQFCSSEIRFESVFVRDFSFQFLTILLIQKRSSEVYAHNPAVSSEGPKHVIRHVSRNVRH